MGKEIGLEKARCKCANQAFTKTVKTGKASMKKTYQAMSMKKIQCSVNLTVLSKQFSDSTVEKALMEYQAIWWVEVVSRPSLPIHA